MNLWPRKNTPAVEQSPVTEAMRQAAVDAGRQGLQSDLLILVERLRSEAPERSSEFEAGVDWSALWLENVARQLTEQDEPSGPQR
jgi:hypothetical protein